MNISNLSSQELRDLLSKTGVELKKRDESMKTEARQKILAIAEEAGLPLKDLIGGSLKIKTVVPVRYRDPDNTNNVWTGRGRQPKWFKAHLDAGKTPDSLTV